MRIVLAVFALIKSVPLSHADTSISFSKALGLTDNDPLLTGSRSAERVTRGVGRLSMRGPFSLEFSPGLRRIGASIGPDFAVALSQTWRLSGLREAHQDRLNATKRLLRQQTRRIRLDVRLHIAKAWIQSWRAQKELAVWQTEEAHASKHAQLMTRARNAQVVAVAEESSAHAYLAQTRTSVLAARGQVHESALRLGEALSQDHAQTARAIRAKGSLPTPRLPAPKEVRRRLDRAAELPGIREIREQVAVARADVVRARARSGWGLTTSVQGARESPGEWYAGLSLAVRLPSSGLNAAAQADRRAKVLMEGSRIPVRIRSEQARMAILAHDLDHTYKQLIAVRDRELPALARARKDASRLASLGEITEMARLQAQSQYHRSVLRQIAAESDHVWVRVQVAILLEAQKEGSR